MANGFYRGTSMRSRSLVRTNLPQLRLRQVCHDSYLPFKDKADEVLNPLNTTNTVDEQTFVRTLNTLCLTHAMQILIMDPTTSETLQQKFRKPLKISSPAVIASRIAARLVHMVLDGNSKPLNQIDWVDNDLSPWRLGDDMLELTPRDVWGFLRTHPNFNEVDLKKFYQTLVDKSYCSGFGPVVSPRDAEAALITVPSPSSQLTNTSL